MDSVTVGIIGIALLVLLMLLRLPVAFAMALMGVVGFAYLATPGAALGLLGRVIFDEFHSYPLTVIPLFILMGSFAYASGISKRLYETTYAWIGHFRGGLTIATVFACAGFGAICGSSTATAATMGQIALPEMKKYKYDDTLATGTVAAAGTLGVLIPPSTILIVYGYITEESIGKLFIAGVLPGILLSIFFALTVALLCWRKPEIGPPGVPVSFKKKLRTSTGIIEPFILFCLAIGGLFLGWFSPTQAGAIGAGGVLIISLARRQMTWRSFVDGGLEGLRTACMVIFIIAGATLFGKFMAISRIPFVLVEWLGGLPIPPMAVMAVIVFIYFIGGFFMDSMALIVLTVPIFFPLVMELGFDPIWFGVIIVLVGEMGVITPPVGVNVFVIKGIAPDVPIERIFWGIIPFVGTLIIVTIILMIFPQIATYLPSFITY
jgi:tripartite ATP-independent transporter DctM subunit